MIRPLLTCLPLLILLAACGEDAVTDVPPVGDPYIPADLGVSLDAGFDDPLLLTIAAARPRTEYLADEGYTLQSDDVLALVTDTAGDLGVAFDVAGTLHAGEPRFGSPVVLRHTASDSLLFTFDLTSELAVEVRTVAATSRVVSIDVWLENRSDSDVELGVIPWLRRCDGGYTHTSSRDGGVTAEHHVRISDEEALFAPGTFVEDAADALVMDGDDVTWTSLETCSDSALVPARHFRLPASEPEQVQYRGGLRGPS